MEAFIKQLAKAAGLSDDMARDVLDTARDLLTQKMTPDQMEKVDDLLADEKQAARAGKLVAKLGKQVAPPPDSSQSVAPEQDVPESVPED